MDVGGAACQSARVAPPIPRWREICFRYRVPTELRTRARGLPFSVVTDGDNLRITPESTGKPRPITQREFERGVALLGITSITAATQNASYIEAIVLDLTGED